MNENKFELTHRASLDLLTMISESILKSRDVVTAFDEIIKKIAVAFQADYGQISIADPRREKMWTIAASGRIFDKNPKKKPVKLTRLNIGDSISGRVYENRQVLIFRDIDADNRFKRELQKTYRDFRFKTAVGIPLEMENRCWGTLALFFSKRLVFSHEQKCFFNILGKQLAIASRLGEVIRSLNYQKNRLEKMASRDSQTELPNHRALQIMLNKSLEEAYRYNNNLSVLMVDIDNFKEINDTHGHLFGDEVLKNLARLFKKNIRRADTVGRYGGDEFLFILPKTGPEKASNLARRLLEAARENSTEKNGDEVVALISIGAASIDPSKPRISPDELLDRADRALYKAKKEGRNRVIKAPQP
ncbi:MAG: diguanylate cyclase [bacterium]